MADDATESIKSRRKIVSRDGVEIMFGQRPFGNNVQAVTIVNNGVHDAAHLRLLDIERKNGLKYADD